MRHRTRMGYSDVLPDKCPVAGAVVGLGAPLLLAVGTSPVASREGAVSTGRSRIRRTPQMVIDSARAIAQHRRPFRTGHSTG